MDIKEFWDKQAEEHGMADTATAPDTHYRTLEIANVIMTLEEEEPMVLLDVGCGNGFTTIEIAKSFPNTKIIGVDYSEAMIEQAKTYEEQFPNVKFVVGDVLSLSRTPVVQGQAFDTVVSTRCLINLANWDEQKLALLEMRKMLTPNGRMIVVENTKHGLATLNDIRADFDLDPINERWHNCYLDDEKFRAFMAEVDGHLFTMEAVENIGNLYYIISRVVYAKLAKLAGEEPRYDHPINEIAAQLPTMGQYYGCSPNYKFILRNAEGSQKWANKSMAS